MIRVPFGSFGILAALCLCTGCAGGGGSGQAFEHFVRREGDVLKEGDREFRFISFNIPNLHYVEDDMRFEQAMPFRLPDAFEIDDALGTIDQIGGKVVRMYTLSVRKADDPPEMTRYILAPGQFNEQAFVALDHVIAAAHRHRVRLILPFIDQWSWWGGTTELAAFRGRKPEEFWTDPQVIEDYKAIVTFVLSRVNTVTGVRYRDDKAILAWETGNELKATDEWTRTVAAHIKNLDRNHLVIDGAMRPTVSEASLADPNIDFVQTHHYDKDVRDMVGGIVRNRKLSAGKKPYHVGEFGFLGTEAMRAVMETVRKEGISGALIWSLRYRAREGGFYWHHEPYGGDRFKAYHWPGHEIGENYDERRFMRLVREEAYAIRGLTPPPLPVPASPRLLAVDAGGQLTWQGTVGAASYDIERADAAGGPWTLVGSGVCEAQVQHRPPFCDESAQPGRSYFYRVRACNSSGRSEPSGPVGPVRISHRILVDELWNDTRMFLKQGKLEFHQNEARKFKEDCHRVSGEPGSAMVYHAPDGIDAVRIFAFSQADGPDIRISCSADCRSFQPVEAQLAAGITHGEGAYGFWKPRLYTARLPRSPYVKIEFLTNAQVSRVEVDHGSPR